jgi:lipopolysaccharide export system permease protein
MKRIDKYIFLEMVPPFLVSILVFSTVLILGKMTLLTKLIVTRGVSIMDIMWLIAAILPSFLVFIIPMATLMAVLLAFHRLSADNEITAMKNAGVSLYRMIRPVAILALMSYAVTMFLCVHALPWGIGTTKQTIQKIVKAHADVVLKEGIFNDVAGKAVVYMGKYTPEAKYMEEVVISDERDPRVRNTIVAEKGYIVSSPDGKSISFRLMDGVISRVEGGSTPPKRFPFTVMI